MLINGELCFSKARLSECSDERREGPPSARVMLDDIAAQAVAIWRAKEGIAQNRPGERLLALRNEVLDTMRGFILHVEFSQVDLHQVRRHHRKVTILVHFADVPERLDSTGRQRCLSPISWPDRLAQMGEAKEACLQY